MVINLLPLTDDTRNLIGADQLARLPDGALYINAGRGGTTDTDALSTRCAASASAPCSTSSSPSHCRPTIRCGTHRA